MFKYLKYIIIILILHIFIYLYIKIYFLFYIYIHILKQELFTVVYKNIMCIFHVDYYACITKNIITFRQKNQNYISTNINRICLITIE